MRLLYVARHYELALEITGKFNVVIGESGIGKTLMTDIARRFMQADGSEVRKPKPIYSVNGWISEKRIANAQDSVFVMDETFESEWLRSVLPTMKQSSNYYIFVTREGLAEVPYGISNVFKVNSNSGRRCYMVPAYSNVTSRVVDRSGTIIAEDSGLGYKHLCDICGEERVLTSQGKSKIANLVFSLPDNQIYTIVCDCCGLGKDARNLLDLQSAGRCRLFDSTSFEQEVLSRAFAKYYNEFTEEDYPGPSTEEGFYVEQLSCLLNKLWGIGYHKNDAQLSQLLEEGTSNVHGVICRMKDVGGVTRQTYRELRDIPSGQASEPGRNSKSISKMSLR